MKFGLAYVDPVTNRFAHWSIQGFGDTDADLDAMQKCIDEYNARQVPENDEYLLLVILPIGDDGEPMESSSEG